MPNQKHSPALSELEDLTPSSIDDLSTFNISSVSDLVKNPIFKTSYLVAKRASEELKFIRRNIDKKHKDKDIDEIGSLKLDALSGIGRALAAKIRKITGATTIFDLGRWPAYLEAITQSTPEKDKETETLTDVDIEEDTPPEEVITGCSLSGSAIEKRFYEVLSVEDYVSTADLSDVASMGFNLRDFVKSQEKIPKVIEGNLATFEQTWTPTHLTQGSVLYSRGLAPAEKVNLAVIDWTRKDGIARSDDTKQEESLQNVLEHNRSIDEIANATAKETQHGFSNTESNVATDSKGIGASGSLGVGAAATDEDGSVSGGMGLGIGGQWNQSNIAAKTFSSATSMGSRNILAKFASNIADIAQQSASSLRSRKASTFIEIEQGESESITTRTIRNYNHRHTLNIVFSEIVQLFKVAVRVRDFDKVLLIKTEIPTKWEFLIDQFREVIESSAKDRRVIEALQGSEEFYTFVFEPDFNEYQSSSSVDSAQTATGFPIVGQTGGWRLPIDTRLESIVVEPEYEDGDAQLIDIYVDVVLIGQIPISAEEVTYAPTGNNNPILTHKWTVNRSLDKIDSVRFELRGHGNLGDHDPWVVITANFSFQGRNFRHQLRTRLSHPIVDKTYDLYSFSTISESGLQDWLVAHLKQYSRYYSREIWANLAENHTLELLSTLQYRGQNLAKLVESRPIGVMGDYLVFKVLTSKVKELDLKDQTFAKLKRKLKRQPVEISADVPISTGGVFAEAYLGCNNASEEIDMRYFWNWQDSPIPDDAPGIAPIHAGGRAQKHDVDTADLESASVQLMAPTPPPNPGAGLEAVLGVIAASNIFRDMSNSNAAAEMTSAIANIAGQIAAQTGDQSSNNLANAMTMASHMASLATELEKQKLGGGSGSGNRPSFGTLNSSQWGGLMNALDKNSPESNTGNQQQTPNTGSSQSSEGPNQAGAPVNANSDRDVGDLLSTSVNGGAGVSGQSQQDQNYVQDEQNESQSSPGFSSFDAHRGRLLLWDFEVGKADLKPAHEQALLELAEHEPSLTAPESGGATISSIAGYTDSIGDADFNITLREERASRVANYLLNEVGVDSDAITDAQGAPAETYLSENTTSSERSYNRSVLLRIHPSPTRIADKMANLDELKDAVLAKQDLNNKWIEHLEDQLAHPLAPGWKETQKSAWERILELALEILKQGRGDPYDPTGGGLAEHLEYEMDMKFWEENRDLWEDEKSYLEYENELIESTLSSMSIVKMNLENGHDVDTGETEERLVNLLKLAYPVLK